MFLSAQEIADLTGKTRAGWQARELEHLQIPYRRRANGSLIVLRAHVEWLHPQKPREPQVRSA